MGQIDLFKNLLYLIGLGKKQLHNVNMNMISQPFGMK